MAVKRSVNPKALPRKRAAFVARVQRTAKQVRRGKLTLVEVVPELRDFVDEELRRVEDTRRPLTPEELASERARAEQEGRDRGAGV